MSTETKFEECPHCKCREIESKNLDIIDLDNTKDAIKTWSFLWCFKPTSTHFCTECKHLWQLQK